MDLFSRKHKLHRTTVGLIHEDVPPGVRRALLNLIAGHLSVQDIRGWMEIQRVIFSAPQIRRDFKYDNVILTAENNVRDIVNLCQWYSIFDICELLSGLFNTSSWKAYFSTLNKEVFEENINEIFADSSIGYLLKDGNIEKLGAPYIDNVISQARQLLQNPKYIGPNEQFEKAIGFLNERPKPDTANCVKDAIGAIEGLARIVTGNNKLILSKILDLESIRSVIPGTLREMMQKLYAYRGDAEGAAHGQTSIERIKIQEAELVIGVSASCMIYLARQLGEEQ